jgi:hypothetical protein
MITPHKQWILEGVTRAQKMEEVVAIPGGPGSFYLETRKTKREVATADNFEICGRRGKMIS